MKPLKKYVFKNMLTKQIAKVITAREDFLQDGWPKGFMLQSITKL